MRRELNIFVDPKTQHGLSLKIEKTRAAHIISGKLYVRNREFPIVRGIPRFVDESYYKGHPVDLGEKQTAGSFGTKWNEARSLKSVLAREDIKNLKEQFMAILGCRTITELKEVFKKSKRSLNAGCGTAWSEYLFNYNPEAERHGLDISLSVEAAYRITKRFRNVVIAQASIFDLPYRDETFDIIYSLGVIHHTPNPKKAFLLLVKKLTPGGLIGIYVYAKKPFLRAMADKEIRRLTTKMSYRECMRFAREMTRLGRTLNGIKQPLYIDKDIELLGIKKGEYSLHRFIYNYFIKCWYNPGQDPDYADLVNQDWYHPYYASSHTREEIYSWFKEGRIKRFKCIQPKGWEQSGYFISGRKE